VPDFNQIRNFWTGFL